MERVDRKYILPATLVESLIDQLSSSYYLVKNYGIAIPEYFSIYFDTPCLSMYFDHHRKKPERFKIRYRKYRASGDAFIEIKHRLGNGKVVKERIEVNEPDIRTSSVAAFIESHTPYRVALLTETLSTEFGRITLVSKSYTERITADFNVKLSSPGTPGGYALTDLCILEVKTLKQNRHGGLAGILKKNGIRASAFSKYSIGHNLLHPNIKGNNFKPILLKLNKIRNGQLNYPTAFQRA